MKKFVEASFKVDVSGLPPIFMDAKSSVEIRKKLRRQLKFPDDIESIERITKGEKIKSFKDRLKSTLDGKGSDVKESAAYHTGLSKSTKSKRKAQFDKQAKMADDNPAAYKPAPGDATAKTKPSVHTKKYKAMYGTEDYSIGLDGKKLKASKALIRRYEEDMLIDPKAMAKKTRFLSPQNKDKLKTDLAKLKKALGPDHPDTATYLNNLALLYDNQGLYAKAEPLYERALVISEKVLGPDHPDTSISLNNIAGLYESQGLYAKAER